MTGRKIYYKIIVRIYELIERKVDLRIFNEGYVIIENEEFEGYLTLDYITGIFKRDQVILIEIDDFENFEEIFSFSGEISDLELPGVYVLNTDVQDDNKICYLEFVNIEKDPLKQKEIERTIKEIKILHEIPN